MTRVSLAQNTQRALDIQERSRCPCEPRQGMRRRIVRRKTMSPRALNLVVAAVGACLALAACGGGATGGNSSQNGKPAGADKTDITNWTDPRPTSWTTKYPYFAPVKIG